MPSSSLIISQKSPHVPSKSPTSQEMKENLSSRKGNQNLNLTNEEICKEEEQSYQNELKTPTGQTSGQYITPTSNMNLVPTKKLGQNAPLQNHHQSKIAIGNVSAGQPVAVGTGGAAS